MVIGAVGHIKVVRITLKSEVGKFPLLHVDINGGESSLLGAKYDTHEYGVFDDETV
jgi:hypothetical protein